MNTAREGVVYIISGGTGRTAEQLVNSALAQFPQARVTVVKKTGIRTLVAARSAVREAVNRPGIICHSLVAPRIRKVVTEQAQQLGIAAVDILGPTIMALNDHLGVMPRGQPGLSYELQKEHFDRIDSVDFTLAHDDGQRVDDLAQADVVLVGVSRVSKSVTCFYLAVHGVRAANVPLIPGVLPPLQLLEVPSARVIGITMNATRLIHLRQTRVAHMNAGKLPHYVDRHAVMAELLAAHDLMRQRGWRALDVSYMSAEEVAQHVLSMMRDTNPSS